MVESKIPKVDASRLSCLRGEKLQPLVDRSPIVTSCSRCGSRTVSDRIQFARSGREKGGKREGPASVARLRPKAHTVGFTSSEITELLSAIRISKKHSDHCGEPATLPSLMTLDSATAGPCGCSEVSYKLYSNFSGTYVLSGAISRSGRFQLPGAVVRRVPSVNEGMRDGQRLTDYNKRLCGCRVNIYMFSQSRLDVVTQASSCCRSRVYYRLP